MDNNYISILLIALCIAISPAASRYTMEITAVSYVNPTDEDSDGGDCDPEPFGGLCDVYFKFCVRDINTPATNDNCWPGHMVESSNDITTQSYIFPPIGPLYPQAGVSNPITFTSSSAWPGSFQLLVVIYDYDRFNSDDLVDRNVFNLVMPADGTTSSNMAELGFYSKATFTARIRVSCQQGFSGDDCLTATPSTTTTTTDTISTTTTTTTSTDTISTTSTGTSTTSTAIIIVTPSTTSTTSGTTTITGNTTTTGTSTTTDTSTRSSSSPTPTTGPNELYVGVGAAGIFIVIVSLVINAVVVVSICCYQKRRKSPPAYEDHDRYPMRNMNYNNETKAALAQGFGVPASHGCEAHIYETAYNKDYTYNYVT